MASKRKIGALITLDGEKKFKEAVSDCSKSLGLMKTEMSLVEAQTAGSANSLEALRAKHDVLSRTLDGQIKKEEAIKVGLKNAERQYSSVGKALADYKERLSQAEKSLKQMEESGTATEEELSTQRQTVESLSASVEKGSKVYKTAGDRVLNWQKQLNTAEAQTIKASKAVNENEARMKEAEGSFDQCAKSIDEFGNQVDQTVETLTSFGTVLKVKVYDTLIDIGGTAVKDAISGALSLEDATQKLAASTGAGAKEMESYSSAIQELYSENYGESVSDLSDKLAYVQQVVGEMDATNLEKLTENAIALEDTFGSDFKETVRGVSNLMSHFGITAEEAFDLFAKGSQLGLDYTSELGDNVAEYGGNFAQAGYTAQEYFQLLVNGSQSGAYNLDKVNDSINEVKNRLGDGTIGESLSLFGEGTQSAFQAWSDGSGTMKAVIDSIVNDIATCENEQQALTMAAKAFGTMGEDANLQVVKSLKSTGTEFQSVKGSMESIKEVRYDSITNQYEKLGRTFQTDVMQPILSKFLPLAKKGMKTLADNIDKVTPVASGLGTAMATIWVTKKARVLLSEIKTTASSLLGLTAKTTAQAAATGTATVAQEGLNTAMAANPIGVVVTAVTALVSGLSMFVALCPSTQSETDELRDSAKEAVDALEESQDTLKSSMQSASDAVSTASASGEMAVGIADELAQLADKTSLTATEQQRMATLVAELNSLYPQMGLEIDSVTGKLNMSSSELKNYADNLKQTAMAQAYQDAFQEAFDAVAAAQKELIDAELEQEKVQQRLGTLQLQYKTALEAGEKASRENGDSVINWMGTQRRAEEVLAEINQEIYDLGEENKNLTEEIKDQQEAVESNTQVADEYMERATQMNEALEQNTSDTVANTQAKGTQAEAAQASIEVAGQELQAYNSLSDSQKTLAVEVTNAVLSMQDNVTSVLQSQMSLFEEFETGTATSLDVMLDNMESQIQGVQTWEQNLKILADRGINVDFLAQLEQMGPKAGQYVQAMVDEGAERMGEINSTWTEYANVQGMTDEIGQQLTESVGVLAAGGEEAFNSLAESLGSKTTQSGQYVVQGLVTGMQEAASQATDAGETLGGDVIQSIDTGAGVQSPSWKTKSTGLNLNLGLSKGMRSNIGIVRSASQCVGGEAVSVIGSKANSGAVKGYGYDVSLGLASGIRQGKSEVINAAKEVAQAAIDSAKGKLEINSPSRVFARLGEYSCEGFVQGFDRSKKTVQKGVADVLNFHVADVRIPTANSMTGNTDQEWLVDAFRRALSSMNLTMRVNQREFGRVIANAGGSS